MHSATKSLTIILCVVCFYTARWFKSGGQVYRQSAFLLTGWQDDDLPLFSRIDDMLVVNGNPFLVVVHHDILGISRHVHSFSIRERVDLTPNNR